MKLTMNNLKDVYGAKRCSIDTAELKGYELVKELFVDSSGFGADNEPALTANQFERELEQLLKEHGMLYAFITNVGQFQVYVGLFKRTGKAIAKKIANNTYRINYPTTDAIRLHDTDILVFESDHVTLNSGGWQSRTTKQRMNQYLPNGVSVVQRNFDWFVQDKRDNTVKEFADGMTIAN